MKQHYTTIHDQDRKLDIIEHVNEDHYEELLDIAKAKTATTELQKVVLKDLFEEGCLLHYSTSTASHELFVPFTIKGELEEKVLYLAYTSMLANGKSLTSSKKQYFEVVTSKFATKNMLRVTVKSPSNIPTGSPGFSYLFALKKLEKMKTVAPQKQRLTFFSKLTNQLFLTAYKFLSSKQRSSVLSSLHKNNRYYTVRKSWLADDQYFAWIDIFLHGNTDGGTWAKNLQPGDIIHSVNNYKEKAAHLNQGKALILGDETSLPAIAGILEHWKNPVPPYLIIITNAKEEQDYLKEFSHFNFTVDFLEHSDRNVDEIKAITNKISGITAIWGGLEQGLASHLRKHFKKTLELPSKNNRIIGYWKKG